MSSVFHIKEHTVEASHIREFARATANSQDEALGMHVKQYVPKDNADPRPGDVTIIGAHANGFPKEMYEPLYEDLYNEAKKRGVRIRAVWVADAAWQGRSGILNAGKLGNDPSWLDYARDITHMINTFRMPRPLVAMGHSFGATALVNVSLHNPRLFSTLVLLDPVISRFASVPGDSKSGPARMSINRREFWPSRDAAVASFRKSPFYRSWDERVLGLWVQFGLVPARRGDDDDDDDEVTLATTKHQELFTYLRPSWPAYDEGGREIVRRDYAPDLNTTINEKWTTYPFYRPEVSSTLLRLPHVRPSVLYVFGGESELSPIDMQEEKVETTGSGVGGSGGAKAGRVRGFTSLKHGHLIPMEAPKLCAEKAAEWIEAEQKKWRVEEREYEEWTKQPLKDKETISEEYRTHIGAPPSKAPKKGDAKL